MSNPAERETVAPTVPGRVTTLPKMPTPFEIGLKVAFAVAQEGALRWFALLSSCALFGFTLAQPSLIRWGVATTYCLLVYIAPNLGKKD